MTAADADARVAQIRARLEALQHDGLWGVPGSQAPALDAPVSPGRASDDATGSTAAADSLERAGAEAAECRACCLCEQRTNVVFGVGNPDARLMFIGEGPGRDEDLQGEPFVGKAGQLLDRIIVAMGLARAEVYIANTVKCRPPNNRNPEAAELAACRPFLDRQIALVNPEVIVLLGRVAAQALLDTTAPLGRLRGRFHDWHGTAVICTYHPAYLLRTPADKGKTWDDMRMVIDRLALTSVSSG